MRVQRPKLRIIAHYMIVEGKTVEIDPVQTDLPDRCKLALAEIMSGKKYVLVEGK